MTEQTHSGATGAKHEVHLSKRDVSTAAWRWAFFCLASQNYERMMGTPFCHSLSGSLEKLYEGDKEGLSRALQRNMTFFNTEPQLGAIIPGICLALEEEKANDPSFDDEIIQSTKNALMGPFAGIGDSILVGTINPILLSIGIGLSAGGNPLGPIVFLALWCGIVIPLKYFLFVKGYDLGADAVKLLTNVELKDKITTALTIVGLIVIGGVAATTISAPIAFTYTSGDMVINLQEILDKIMPNLVPLVIALVSYLLVSKKGWSANKLIVAILIFAAVMVVTGIM
ncbi:PTS system mannose/fructose/sorbose family transporter subunit IID [Thermophilibacter mediterraneus]|uniref:PTS system mannose/fructose/sorbose family transporter subunit IID n=1 Tax=Thermophilibacter mediterraneus TaxID=1871031 RepID=UPI00093171DF|nr:PTS system mannose/fructose/sorbose family transporter subunit IID [Thermophilibacter mediterraneus]